jgi:hypothetical protein
VAADLDAIKERWGREALDYAHGKRLAVYPLPARAGVHGSVSVGIEGDPQGHLAEVVGWMEQLADSFVHAPDDIAALVAEVEDLRAKLTASRRQVRAAVACLTTPSARPDDDVPLRPWQIAFRLRRAGLRRDGKDHVNGTVIAEYEHPGSHYIGATIHVTYEEVGRR